ncbi:MAG: hypothetical protein ACPLSK_01030 [bacterium]
MIDNLKILSLFILLLPLSFTKGSGKPSFIILPSGYLAFSDGRSFFPLGGFYANWPAILRENEEALQTYDLFPCGPTPYKEGYPWSEEVEKIVRNWLEFCHRSGVTALRLMLRNMDIVGDVDEVQLKAVKHLFALAKPFNIYFDVVLFEDFDKPPYVNEEILEKIVLPKYEGKDLSKLPSYRRRFLVEKRLAKDKYKDPDVIACQKDYLRKLIPQLAQEEQIFCYELENEMVNPPISWINEMVEFIKHLDPKHLILADPLVSDFSTPLAWRDTKIDIFSYHPYNDGFPYADYGAVIYTKSKWASLVEKPRFTGEGGINQNRWQKDVKKVSEEQAVRGVRDQIWLTITNGECGAFLWSAELKGEVREFGKAKEVLAKLNVKKLKRKKPDIGLVIPKRNSEELCMRWAWFMLDKGLDFDFLPQPSKDYKICFTIDSPPSPDISLPQSPCKPSPGYQASYLMSEDRGQILIYLRNTAGGIKDFGDGRPCYLRDLQPALAKLSLNIPGRYTASIYDLEKGKWLERKRVDGKGELLIARETTSDYVVILHSLER